jgi:orotidine-5'-phosphate decarboxylase
MNHQVICSLDTDQLAQAEATISRLAPFVGAFKVGHALTLGPGLGVLEKLKAAGARRIFLDLKFHDIPNTVALAVREASKHGVWMVTLHTSGGPAMLSAAVEEVSSLPIEERPLLVGVSVLTSLDEPTLQGPLGVHRSLTEQALALSQMATEQGLDGVVASAHEAAAIRAALGPSPIIVTPGIRARTGQTHDQKRVADARTALENGASYLVMGRALSESTDPLATLAELGFETDR